MKNEKWRKKITERKKESVKVVAAWSSKLSSVAKKISYSIIKKKKRKKINISKKKAIESYEKRQKKKKKVKENIEGIVLDMMCLSILLLEEYYSDLLKKIPIQLWREIIRKSKYFTIEMKWRDTMTKSLQLTVGKKENHS